MRIIVAFMLLGGACSNKLFVPSGPDTRVLLAPPLVSCDTAAAPLTTVRLATWNMDSALTGPLPDIAAVLAGIGADVVLLQEVDDHVQRSGDVNQAAFLATQLGTSYIFAETTPWQDGHYGTAMLSKLPVAAVKRISLDAEDASERRIGLDVTLCFGPLAMHVVNLHADIVSDAGAANARQLLGAIAPEVGKGLVLAGDLNAAPTDAGPRAALAAGLTDVVVKYDATPTWETRRQDLVFADAKLAPHASGAHVVVSSKSDHNAVVVDFTGPF